MSMDQLMALVPIEAATAKKKRKTRWERIMERKGGSGFGPEDEKPYLPPPFVDLPCGLTPGQMDQFFREQRYQELSKKLADGELEFGDEDIRPPSPPPMYDKMGSRTNTREIRIKTAMTDELQRLTEFMISTVDTFVPPPDYKPSKKQRRIEIPLDKYPDYNFMGLIIGPRGCNHKRLEAESGAQISIRGRGTQKDGKRDHQSEEESQMPMHVHIVADTEEILDRAVNLVEPLLDPFHPMHEEFKKRGLTQLALVNGVNYSALDQQRCAVCGATGHLATECQDAKELQNFKKAEVRCAICGDKGHVTMDCKLAKQRGTGTAQRPTPPPPGATPAALEAGKSPYQVYMEKVRMDQEYQKMMSELSGNSSGLDGLDGDSSSQKASTPGTRGVGPSNSTPPPGVSPGMMGSVRPSSPFPGAPPPPPDAGPRRTTGRMQGRPGLGAGSVGARPPPPPSPTAWGQPQFPGLASPGVMAGGPAAAMQAAMQNRLCFPGQAPPLFPGPPFAGAPGFPPLFGAPMGIPPMQPNGLPGQHMQAQMAAYQNMAMMGAYQPGLIPSPLAAVSPQTPGTVGRIPGSLAVKSDSVSALTSSAKENVAGADGDMDTSN